MAIDRSKDRKVPENTLYEKYFAPKKEGVDPPNKADNSDYVPTREEVLDLVHRVKNRNTDNDSFLDNFIEGLQIGGRQLAGGFAYASGEVADRLGFNEAGQKTKLVAQNYMNDAPASDDSWGQFIGGLIPSVVPSAVAIVTANPTLAYASMGTLGLSSTGSGMLEYESYKKSKGLEVDDNAKLFVGLAYGSAEVIAEKLSLSKLMPNVNAKLLFKGNVRSAEQAGESLFKAYQRSNPQQAKALLNRIRTGMTYEGLEEVITEISQTATNAFFKEQPDMVEELQSLPDNMMKAFLGGAIMGGGLGPLSFNAQNRENRQRRLNNGKVILVQADGQPYELIESTESDGVQGFNALDKYGDIQFLPEESIQEYVDLTNDQYDKLLQDKFDEQEYKLSQIKPSTIGRYGDKEVEIVGTDSFSGDVYIKVDGEQKIVQKELVTEIQDLSPEEQYMAQGNELVEGLDAPIEALTEEIDLDIIGQDTPKPIQNLDGDYIYPNQEGYAEAVKATQPREVTIGSGNRIQKVQLQPTQEGLYEVSMVTGVQDGEPMPRPIDELTDEEKQKIATQLNKQLKARGFNAFTKLTDPNDDFSALSIQVAKPKKKTTLPQEATTEPTSKDNDYEIQINDNKISLLNADGKEVGVQSKYYQPKITEFFTKAAQSYANIPRYTDNNPDITEANYLTEIANGSENPLELAEAYLEALSQQELDKDVSNKDIAIANDLASSRIPSSDLKGRGLDNMIAFANYGASRAETDIAQRAEYLTDQVGTEITVDDILDFIKEHPNGPKTVLNQKSEKVTAIEERFKEVTGASISKTLAQSMTNANIDSIRATAQPTQEPPINDENIEQTPIDTFIQDEDISKEELAEIEQLLIQEGVSQDEIDQIKEAEPRILEEEIETIESQAEIADSEEQALQELTKFFEDVSKPTDTPKLKTPEQKQIEEALLQVEENYATSVDAFKRKLRELNQTAQGDAENLFGERKDDLDPQAKMFDMRVDPSQMEKALKPYRTRRDKAKEEISKLRKDLRDIVDGKVSSTSEIDFIDSSRTANPKETTSRSTLQDEPLIDEDSKEEAGTGEATVSPDSSNAKQTQPVKETAKKTAILTKKPSKKVTSKKEVTPKETKPKVDSNALQGGENNTTFTKEASEEALQKLREKLGSNSDIVEEPKRGYLNDEAKETITIAGTNEEIGFVSEARKEYNSARTTKKGSTDRGRGKVSDTEQYFGEGVKPRYWKTITQFTPTNVFELSTGKKAIESPYDVAHLMRALEDEAVEHFFALYIDEQGNAIPHHVSTGGTNATVVEPKTVVAGVKRFNAKKVYILHNHPSGKMEPSDADRILTEKIKESLGDVELVHIIMDTYKGEFITFWDDTAGGYMGNGNYEVKNRHDVSSLAEYVNNNHTFDVVRFSKRIYNQDVIRDDLFEDIHVTSPDKAASFFHSHRYSVGDKLEVLLIDTSAKPVAIYAVPDFKTTDEVFDFTKNVAALHGANSVIYGGRQENKYVDFKELSSKMKSLGVPITDVILVDTSEKNYSNYTSLMSSGLIREEATSYGNNDSSKPLDPELLQLGIQVGGYFIESGTTDFKSWSNQMIEVSGTKINPYLKSIYNALRYYPGIDTSEFTSQADIDDNAVEKKKTRKVNSNNEIKNEIKDFGETIYGAKKHLYASYLKDLQNVSSNELISLPLSKSLPEPNYQKLLDDKIIDYKGAVYLKSIRSQIGRKPKNKYRLRLWEKKASILKSIYEKVYSKEINFSEYVDETLDLKNSYTAKQLFKMNIALHRSMGWPKNNVNKGKYDFAFFPKTEEKTGKLNKDRYSIVSGRLIKSDHESLSDAVIAMEFLINKNKKTSRKTKFNVYKRTKEKDFYIGKKNGKYVLKIKTGFDTSGEAFDYLDNNYDELLQSLNNLKQIPNMRKATNSERIGGSYRKDIDITPAKFQETFGFRGVQFGNYVNQKERQEALNNAYDGLMDLANVLGLPPKGISLSGELGLAFGARGQGGLDAASAHYEPNKVIINLTKRKGAGSLAHEWWHALDNYFSRVQGYKFSYLSQKPYKTTNSKLRDEISNAFIDIIKGINESDLKVRSAELDKRRTQAYYNTTIELTARAFESYVLDRLSTFDTSNDYLVNIHSKNVWDELDAFNQLFYSKNTKDEKIETYPYLLEGELNKITPLFDHLFNTIEAKENSDGKVVLTKLTDILTKSTDTPVFRGNKPSVLRDHLKNLIKDWKVKDSIIIVDRTEDLPHRLRLRVEQEAKLIPGVYYNGKVYLLSHNMSGIENAEKTLAHEVIGHLGVRGLLKNLSHSEKDFETRLANLANNVHARFKNDTLYTEIVERYRLDPENFQDDRVEVAQEYIAHLAEQRKEPSLVKKFINWVEDLLKALGFQNKMTRNDIHNLIKNARKYVENEANIIRDGKVVNQPLFKKKDILQEVPHHYQKGVENRFFKNRDKIQRLMQDSFIDVQRIQEGVVKDGGTITDDSDIHAESTLHLGRIEEKKEYFNNTFYKPFFDDLNKLYNEKGVKYEDVWDYLYAKHAPERNEYLFGKNPVNGKAQSGKTDTWAAETLQQLKEKGVYEAIEKIAKERVYPIYDYVLETRLNTGLISQKRYEELKNQFKYYVPLRGFKDLVDIDPTVYSADYEMKGRTSEAGDILAYTFAMVDTAIVQGEKNKLKQAVLNFAIENHKRSDLLAIQNVYWKKTGQKNDDGKDIYSPIFNPNSKEILDENVKRYLDMDSEHGAWYENDTSGNPFWESNVRVMVDGRPVNISFKTPHIPHAVNSIGIEKAPQLFSFMNRYMSYLRHVITQYSPEFMTRNLVRDTMTGFLNLGIDFDTPTAIKITNPARLAKAWNAVRVYYRKGNFEGEFGEAFDSFRKNGGISGWWQLNQVQERTKNLKSLMESKPFGKNGIKDLKKVAKATGQFLDDYNRAFENVVRVSTFKYLLDNKVINKATGTAYTPKQAALYAKDLTVNFNRKGTYGNSIGSVFLFFNATVQGIARQVQPFFSDDKKIQSRAFATPLVMGLTSYAFIEAIRYSMGEDEDGESYYDKMSDWTRTHNITLPNLLSDDPADSIKIPLPYGYNVYWAVGDVANRVTRGVTSINDGVLSLLTTIAESFNPIGTQTGDNLGEAVQKTLTPSILQPGLELVTNRNFAGMPIKPEPFPFAPEEPKSQQYYKNVSNWAKSMATFLNKASGGDTVTSGVLDVSPEHLEYLVEYFGGGLARFVDGVISTTTNVVSDLTGEEDFTLEDDIYDIPFIRSFYGTVSNKVDRSRFFEHSKEIKNAVHKYNKYVELDTDKAIDYYKQHKALIDMDVSLKAIQKQLRYYKKILRLTETSDDVKDRSFEKTITDAMHELMVSFNKMYNQAVKRKSLSDFIR